MKQLRSIPMEMKQLQRLVGGQGKPLPPPPPTTYTTTTPNKYVPYGVRLRLEWLAKVRAKEKLRTIVEYTKDGLSTYQNAEEVKAIQKKTHPPFSLLNKKPPDPPKASLLTTTKVDPVSLTVGETPKEQQPAVLSEIEGNNSKEPNPVLAASCGIGKKFPKSKKTKIGQRISARSRSKPRRSKSRSSKIPRSDKTIPVDPTTPKMLYQSDDNACDNNNSGGMVSKKRVVAGNSGSHPPFVAARSSSRNHRRRSTTRRIKKYPSPKRSVLRSKLLSDVRVEVARASKSLRSKSAEQDASTSELKPPVPVVMKPANSYEDDSVASKVQGAVKRVNFQAGAFLPVTPLSRSKSEEKRKNSKHKKVQVDLECTTANPNYSKDIYSKIGVTVVERRAIVKKPIRRKSKMKRKPGGSLDSSLPQSTADSAATDAGDISLSTQSLGFTDESLTSLDNSGKSRGTVLLEDFRARLSNGQGKADILPLAIDVISHKSNSTESIFQPHSLPKTSQQLGVSQVVSVSIDASSRRKAKLKTRRKKSSSASRNKTKGWRAAR